MARLLNAAASQACWLYALAAFALLTPPQRLPAQTMPGPVIGSGRNMHPGSDDEDPFRNNPEIRGRIERGRASERQKRMVDDANRLVALTVQYREAVRAHGKPTDEDQKLLVQIEKAARDLKDRMRGM